MNVCTNTRRQFKSPGIPGYSASVLLDYGELFSRQGRQMVAGPGGLAEPDLLGWGNKERLSAADGAPSSADISAPELNENGLKPAFRQED